MFVNDVIIISFLHKQTQISSGSVWRGYGGHHGNIQHRDSVQLENKAREAADLIIL